MVQYLMEPKISFAVQIVASCSDMKRIDNDVTDGTYNLTSLAWKISVGANCFFIC